MNKLNELDNKNIYELIENITPLNNKYRDLIKEKSSGTKVVVIMWEVGNLLHIFLLRNKIKPHKLYWKIYGKSEGTRTSYITRDFLSYCFRIRKYFSKKEEIEKNFYNLERYSSFREALPLLENPKYKLDKKSQSILIRLLNSNIPPMQIKENIIQLKKNRIGIKNTRYQRLREMEPSAKIFASFYNYIYKIYKENNDTEAKSFRTLIGENVLNNLSAMIASLAREGLFIPKFKYKNYQNIRFNSFMGTLKELINKNIEDRNRFRRLFPPRKIIRLADMIYSLSSYKLMIDFREKLNFQSKE